MPDNLTDQFNPLKTSPQKDEKAFWIQKILDLRAYLEQEQEANKAIYENYEKAQIDLSNGIELGTQLCLDLKAQYLQRIEELNKEISRLQYQFSQELQKLRTGLKSS
jgi:uncharacterized protein (UPF0335 family)